MSRTALAFAVVLLLLTAGSALADLVTFDQGNTSGQTWDGFYVSPYWATIGTGPEQPFFCIDFNHEVVDGEQWTAAIQTIPISSDPLPGGPPTYPVLAVFNTDLIQAAWIFQEEGLTINGLLFTPQLAQVAVWQLFVNVLQPPDNAVTLANGINSDGTGGVTAAHVAAVLADPVGHLTGAWDLVSVSPPGSTSPQSFLTPTGGNNEIVPEPASILLLGVVLLGCGRGLARRWS